MNSRQPFFKLLFSYAFRPLFLLVVAQALFGIVLWFGWWSGFLSYQWQVNPTYWHGHDMIMGLAGAAIAGFLLTAVATWTGRPPVTGWPLILLCATWILARLYPLVPLVGASAGIFYWCWLLLIMAREVISVGNNRNYKVLFLLALFLALESLYYYAEISMTAWQRSILWAQIWLVLGMISLIGGRIIPAFTRNWLLRQQPELTPGQLPAAFGAVDIAANLALLLFALSTLLPVPIELTLILTAATAVLQAWRLLRWQGLRTFAGPLVWMLHLSYAWIPFGVLLFGLGRAGYLPVSAGIHALTIGTIAGMIISVSARAALGHPGRPLASHPLLTCAIVLLGLAALARVAASATESDFMLTSAVIFWLCGFLCFAYVYAPILLSPSLPQSEPEKLK